MKTIITSSGQIGKFSEYQTLSDRYVCDGVEYPFSVLGEAHEIGDYVEQAININYFNYTKALINDPIIAEIAQLDLKRIRPLAEGDSAYLATLNAQIAALRAKLVK